MKKNILITGVPGIGKTTIIVRLLEALKGFCAAGFYTKEIRQGGIRKGFELIDLTGKKSILSHVSIKSPFRVSKYGVDIQGFEEFLDAIAFFDPATDVIIIDEIGKMECLSQKFNTLLEKIMDAEKPLIATIALKGSGIIRLIKERPDVRLFELKPDNRQSLLRDILLLIDYR
ncbi:MAG: NTPase [Deltaproteobacteria bacterium]|nr:MAG: NTPase [Deltaproteobacteria bacterium]